MNSFTVQRFIRNKNLNRYWKVQQFSEDNSKLITSMLRQPEKGTIGDLYFDDIGSIRIKRNDYDDVILLNPLGKREPSFDSGSIIEPNDSTDLKMFYSKNNGAFFLYVDDSNALKPIVTMYYNPIAHPEFSQFYNESSNKEQVNNYVVDGCLENQAADPICFCMNKSQVKSTDPDTEFCMNDLFNGDSDLRKKIKNSENRQGYDQLAKVCKCSNVNCKMETHPLMQVQDKCPTSLVVTMCNTSFNAAEGANLMTGGMNIAQSCSGNVGGGVKDPPLPAPPAPTPYAPLTPITPDFENLGTSQSNTIVYVIGGGVTLLIIGIIIYILAK